MSSDDVRVQAIRALGGAGPVMLIGGAEDKVRDKVVLSRFANDAGGAHGHVVVVSTASSLGDLASERYRDLFGGLGIGRVTGLRPEERAEADSPEVAQALSDATAVFLTGGNQLRLSSVVAGTRLADAIQRAHDRGAVLAGTSAGASAMAAHMMAFGRSGETPKTRMAQLAAGLGIVQGVVIDQHFQQRGRFGRLLAVVAQSPSLVGIGLDEDTCAIVHADRTIEVIGRGAVTLIDGSHVVTDAHQAKGHRPIMVSGAVVHSLPAGTWFDLRARRLLAGEPGVEREASE
ncbi:MAG TPA: cyanophycinase [Actinomycetota bacterium]|nr:cyanophycinase [Actinomycetota bacterium]